MLFIETDNWLQYVLNGLSFADYNFTGGVSIIGVGTLHVGGGRGQLITFVTTHEWDAQATLLSRIMKKGDYFIC